MISDARAETEKRCIIILGMHRSGTSAVTGSLQQAGLFLGDVSSEDPDNQKGNREPPLLNVLHEELLAANGGSWIEPPIPVRWERIHRACRDLFIATFGDRPLWGFKDPRTLLTLAEWLSALPHAELVGVFRHPDHVAQSLSSRDGLSLEAGQKLWTTYNRALLWWCERRPDLRLIEFGPNPDATAAAIHNLTRSLALPHAEEPNPRTGQGLTDSGPSFFDRTLIHNTGGEPFMGQARAESLMLYAKLQAHSSNGDPIVTHLGQQLEDGEVVQI